VGRSCFTWFSDDPLFKQRPILYHFVTEVVMVKRHYSCDLLAIPDKARGLDWKVPKTKSLPECIVAHYSFNALFHNLETRVIQEPCQKSSFSIPNSTSRVLEISVMYLVGHKVAIQPNLA
jgi:hypothetical protein